MKRHLILLIVIIIPILVSAQESCTYFIDNRLCDYLFNEGSYWVYENDSNLVDSLVVMNVEHDIIPEVWIHGERASCAVEYYKIFYESKTLNYQTWDEYLGYVIVREGVNWGNNGQYIFLSSYRVGDYSGGAEIINTIDTFKIENLEFYNVTKMFVMNNKFENNNPTCYYYANGVGIVRKEILSKDTTQIIEKWNLKNYKVDLFLTGSNEFKNNKELIAFPNPSDRFIHLRLAQNDLFSKLHIYNLSGNIVYERIILDKNIDLDLSNLKKGGYLIVIENKTMSKSLKILKN